MLRAGSVRWSRYGCDFGARYWGTFQSMLDFLASIMDVSGGVPAMGDADQGVLVRFGPDRRRVLARRLSIAARDRCRAFGRPEFRAKAGRLDDKTRWLLGDGAIARFEALDASEAQLPVRRSSPHAGYYILGDKFDASDEVRIVADAGSPGYLSIAVRGHADALAFTRSIGGRTFLVDSGTHTHYAARAWRRYFRGTSAHNTIMIDGEDRSVFGGPFLWLQHAHVTVDEFVRSPDLQVPVACHEGYTRLAGPVLHRRTWRYEAASAMLTVRDELRCSGAHRAEIFWHFAPECRFDCDVAASRPSATVCMWSFNVPMLCR